MDDGLKRHSRRAAVGIAAVVAAGGAGQALAGGVKTSVKITGGGPQGLEGKVNSKSPGCERGRKVTAFYDLSKSGVTEPGVKDPKVGSDRTDRKGRFQIEQPLTAGTYYAKVAKKKAGKRKCAKAKSRGKRL